MTITYMEFRIADSGAYKAWCELVGCQIAGDSVRVTPEFYRKHSNQIESIQTVSALKRWLES